MSQETTMTTDTSTVHDMRSAPAKRRALLGCLAAAACLLAAALLPSAALAAFRITSFTSSNINPDLTPDTQAGSHPWESITAFNFSTTTDSSGTQVPDGNMKDVEVGLPAGFVGNPNATPKCLPADLSNNNCSPASQIGQLTLQTPLTSSGLTLPVFNMVAPPGVPAEFGANVLLVNAFIDVVVRTGGDYGLTAELTDISAGLPLSGSSLTLWGVPADPSHDSVRSCQGGGTGCAAGVPPTPFLTLPTQCTGQPLVTTLAADSWQGESTATPQASPVIPNATSPAMTGCNNLSFNPSVSVAPTTTVADSPTGLDIDVHVPQAPVDPTGLVTPALLNSSVTLPSGLALTPASADGLQGCTPAEIGMNNASQPTCPDASKIGTAEIDSPISADPLTGSIYLAQPNDNPFNSLVAIYAVAQADGVLVKLAGHVQADPSTGQLTTTFDNSPPLPFSDLKLDFFSGPRATFATPEQCGTFTATSNLQPFSAPASGANSTPSGSFAVSSGCVDPFAPSFVAGSTSTQAGAYSAFALSFSRSDTDQELSGLTATLPPGVLAKLAGVQECSDAQIAQAEQSSGAAELASPSCPAGSQVGTAETAAGAGSDPLFTSGNVYLTGPYKGAPYGLVVIVPALAGPFDLGTVVVRQALFVDPTDAHVTVVSDPFPTIMQGIPLRLKRIDVVLTRPDFTLNPTSCDPMHVTAALTSIEGTSAVLSSPFQVGGCQALGFSPKLAISLSGKGKTRSGDHPTLTATLTPPAGQANISSARVTLPLSLALDPNNSKRVCSYNVAQAVHGGAVACPADTIVGTASASTPLLSQPLTGNIYLVQGIRFNAQGQPIRTLPTLLIPLRGQLALDLRASTAVNGAGALINTFGTVPDVPVSSFNLQITGGPKGLLVITGRGQSICTAKQTSTATLDAQSGKQENISLRLGTPCGKASKTPVHHKTKKRNKKKKKGARRSG
jgi:hypothetical protein